MKYVLELRFDSDEARSAFIGQFLDGWGEGEAEIDCDLKTSEWRKEPMHFDVRSFNGLGAAERE